MIRRLRASVLFICLASLLAQVALAGDSSASLNLSQPHAADQTGATSGPCPPQQAITPGSALDWYEAWKKFKEDLERTTGTTLSLCLIETPQVALNGPAEGNVRNVFWWNLGLNQKLWSGARLITNTRGGKGDGLHKLIDEKLSTNWMASEPDPLYVSHCLLEQKLWDDSVTLWLGKLDVDDYFDTNEVASWNFLSYSLARNPTVPCPWHAIGAVARYAPAEWLYLQAGVADAQGSWTETGFRTAFHDEAYTVSMYEVGLRPKVNGRQGNYRFILWYDAEQLDRVDDVGTERDDAGFALGFDQALTDKVAAFFRYGCADEAIREIEHYWSLGAVRTGPFPSRPDDELAFGVSQGIMGQDYRDKNRSAPQETLVEVYYKIQVNPWLSIKPDLQVILNPGAERDEDVSVVAGVRMQLSL
ncbi:MAG TPA: carbohydrate porin [Phycisphaerae bacterium]|nr:carbohydrate porin [Phycisphaerae bacterium]